MLQFDTHTGRPYSRLSKLCGTGAVHYGYPSRLYFDHGPTWDWHRWEDEDSAGVAREAGVHPFGPPCNTASRTTNKAMGMDFVMMYRLIRCLNEGVSLDLSVYDGALWSLVGALSSGPLPQRTNAWTSRRHRRTVEYLLGASGVPPGVSVTEPRIDSRPILAAMRNVLGVLAIVGNDGHSWVRSTTSFGLWPLR